MLAKDGGEVALDGAPITAADRRRFGYMPEERGLYPKMRVGEHIAYLARLHGYGKAEATKAAESLLDRLGLSERLRDNVETLSLGNQQRAQIAAALVHDPRGAHPRRALLGARPARGRRRRRRAARSAPPPGTAVLFSSHQLDVVERLCDDLVIIADGTVRAAGARDALQAEHAGHRFELVSTGDAGWIRDEPGVTVVELRRRLRPLRCDRARRAAGAPPCGRARRRRQLRPAASDPRADLQGGHQ